MEERRPKNSLSDFEEIQEEIDLLPAIKTYDEVIDLKEFMQEWNRPMG